jgi:hypothetical protein
VKEMEKPKYYGKQTYKENHPYKKKEKSKGNTYAVENDTDLEYENEENADYA